MQTIVNNSSALTGFAISSQIHTFVLFWVNNKQFQKWLFNESVNSDTRRERSQRSRFFLLWHSIFIFSSCKQMIVFGLRISLFKKLKVYFYCFYFFIRRILWMYPAISLLSSPVVSLTCTLRKAVDSRPSTVDWCYTVQECDARADAIKNYCRVQNHLSINNPGFVYTSHW